MRTGRRVWYRVAGALGRARRERQRTAQAELKFGGIASAKESYRNQRSLPVLETFARDARYAWRMMLRNPGFTTLAMLSLALGMAGATAIFSMINSTLLRPLPYGDPARLVTINVGGALPATLYDRFRSEARSIEQAAIFVNISLNLAGHSEPERVPAARVSASLFPLLGVKAHLGRTFTPAEDQPGGAQVVILGDSLWKRRFAGDPHVLGRKLLVNGAPQTVIGIMPPGFQFPDGPELPAWAGSFPPAEMWRPMAMPNDERTCGGCWNFAMIARLRPGVPLSQARQELVRLLHAPGSGESELSVRSLKDTVSGQARTPLAILFAAVVVALLIACVNVANLLIARGLRRRPEIALRISLGAPRSRIARQLFNESLVLALCAALLAVPLSAIAIRALVAIAPANVPGATAAALDGRALVFALGLAVLTALLFGVAPALATMRRDPVDALKGGGRPAAGRRAPLGRALVVAEFAMSLVLVVAASLLAKSFLTVARTPLGFHAENVLTMRLLLPDARYGEKQRAAFADQITGRCAALPGVMSAAAVSTLPLTGEAEGWGINPDDSDSRHVTFRVRSITPAYFRALGIRLRSGRELLPTDRGTHAVAIVSQSGARLRWPGLRDPIGRKIGGMSVIGIVDDTRASGLDSEVHPYLYVPFSRFAPEEFALAVRSASDPARLAAAIKSEIWRLDREQPVTHVSVMRQLVADSIAPRRFQAVLMGLFAAFALLLASIGIYGVVAYAVAQRTHEIGIRMALGATRIQILGSVVAGAGALAMAGVGCGLVAAYVLTPLLGSLLYGVSAVAPPVFAASALVLIAVAVVAGFIPALRAARVDPMVCLRYE